MTVILQRHCIRWRPFTDDSQIYSSRVIKDAEGIDGCAINWVLQLPSKGFIKDVVLNFVKYATKKMHSYWRTHVLCWSVQHEHQGWNQVAASMRVFRGYKRTMNAPLPQQQVVLSVTKNKVQLVELISEEYNFKNLMMCPWTQIGHCREISCTSGSEKRRVGPNMWLEDGTWRGRWHHSSARGGAGRYGV